MHKRILILALKIDLLKNKIKGIVFKNPKNFVLFIFIFIGNYIY